MREKSDTLSGFDKTTSLPESDIQRNEWQKRNRTWWENHPMRYDWKNDIQFGEFSKDFYLEIDKRFFSNAREYMPYTRYPFDSLINFDELNNKDVLEIGVGIGSYAQLLARHAKSYTGIDLTDYAVRSTAKRLELFKLNAKIVHMDAEKMDFADNTFDFIWTWGVIHHSANTEEILKEMHRILKPHGTATVMVYHRNIWNYYVINGLVRGIIQGALFKTKSLNKITQQHSDGAIARYYTTSEWRSLTSKYFDVEKICIYGQKSDLFPIPSGGIKNFLMAVMPNGISRFFTNQLKFGGFVVSTLKKK